MTYTLLPTPNLTLESMTVLEALYSGESMRDTRDEVIKNNGGEYAEETRALFAGSIELEDYVKEKFHYDESVMNFLFKKRKEEGNIPAITFFAHDIFLQNEMNEKLLSVLIYALEYEYSTPDAVTNPPRLSGSGASEGELFELLESTGLDVETKYETAQLYFRFDEYYAHYKKIIAQASACVEEKVPAFAAEIESFLRVISKNLAEKGFAFFKEKWGLEISPDVSFDISPKLYGVNSISVGGMPAPYAKRHTISIGLGVDRITEISENCRPISRFLPDFLKTLSDNTKWTILQMLKDGPLYGGQLAERLNLTGATISHHMAALKSLELILMKKDASKVYYSLNKERLNAFLTELSRSF